MDGNVVTKHLNQSTYLLYEFYFILCRYWILKISLRSNIKGSKQAKVGHYKFYRNNMGCMLNSADRVIFDRQKRCLEIQCMWFELTHLSKEQRIGEKCNYCTYQEDIEKPQKGEHRLSTRWIPSHLLRLWDGCQCELNVCRLSEFEGWLWAHEHLLWWGSQALPETSGSSE